MLSGPDFDFYCNSVKMNRQNFHPYQEYLIYFYLTWESGDIFNYVNQVFFMLMSGEPIVNITDLQALYLTGPTDKGPVQDPLAV